MFAAATRLSTKQLNRRRLKGLAEQILLGCCAVSGNGNKWVAAVSR